MPGFTPEIGAALAKILADVGGTFAVDNPVQQGLGQLLQSSTTGLIKAQAFNRQNDELSAQILSIINNGAETLPLEGLRPGDPTKQVVPGGRTLGDVGLTDPTRIDPIQALALGGQGVQDTIRTRQQERFRVERVLERETDLSNRIKAIKLADKNRADVEELKLKNAVLLDESRGGPQQRAANLQSTLASTESTLGATARQPGVNEAGDIRTREAFALDVSTRGQQARTQTAERALESAATPEQAQQLRKSEIKQKAAQADIAASDAETRDALNQAQLRVAELKANRTPAELASIQRTAIRQVQPGIMRQLRRRLGGDSQELEQIASFMKLLGGDELDEAGRRSTMAAMISLLNPEELQFFQEQLAAAEEAVLSGKLASEGVTIGSVPPLIEDITSLSLGEAQEESDFLNRR